MNPLRIRQAAIALMLALIGLVVAWQCSQGISPVRALAGLVLTLPLWAPLRGVVRGSRRTYAWATLCVIPYFILGTTEAIASPAQRLWSGACLSLAFALFVCLILYLRVSNPARASGR